MRNVKTPHINNGVFFLWLHSRFRLTLCILFVYFFFSLFQSSIRTAQYTQVTLTINEVRQNFPQKNSKHTHKNLVKKTYVSYNKKKGKQVQTGKKKFHKKSEKNAYCYLLLRIQVAKSLKTTSSHFLDGDDFFLTRYKLRADFTRFVSFPLELVCGASLSNLCFFFLLPSIYCSLVRVVAYFLSSKLCSFFVVTDLDRFLSHLYY